MATMHMNKVLFHLFLYNKKILILEFRMFLYSIDGPVYRTIAITLSTIIAVLMRIVTTTSNKTVTPTLSYAVL